MRTVERPLLLQLTLVVGALLLLCWQGLSLARSPIRVGVTVAQSGQYAVPGSADLEGMRLWVHDINQRGGLLGRPVELVHYDDKSDPQRSTRLYERLISKDKVDLLLGPYGSDITMAASRVAEYHHFPMVASGAADEDIWARGYLNIFGIDAQAEHYADPLLAAAAEAGITRLALVYADNNFPRQLARGVRRQAARYGMRIVFEHEYPQSQTEFGALMRQMRATRPELLIGGTYLKDSIALVQAAHRAGFRPRGMAFTVGPALPEFVQALGAQAEGALGLVSWMRSAGLPLAMDFSYRYKRLYGHNASVQAALGYAAGQVLEAAVRLADSLDRNAVRSQLRGMTFQSLLGRYKVDATGKQTAKTTYVLQIRDGDRVLVLPASLDQHRLRFAPETAADAPQHVSR